MSSFGRTASGLQCSWGSKLDEKVPRAKMPKCALPPDVRQKMGLARDKRAETDEATVKYFSEPGFGVAKQKGHNTDAYSAGNQKNFLKRRSGAQMSERIPQARQTGVRAAFGGNHLVKSTNQSTSFAQINAVTIGG